MAFAKQLVDAIPNLRAFAITLCGDRHRAEDLVQETCLKAWRNQQSYQDRTQFIAWIFTILRNTYFSEIRKRRREVQDVDGIEAGRLTVPANQFDRVRVNELSMAWHSLSFEQQEVLMLVNVEGVSYEDAGMILGVATGTVKSRVNRARNALCEMLDEEIPKTELDEAWEKVQAQDFGSDVDLPTQMNEASERD